MIYLKLAGVLLAWAAIVVFVLSMFKANLGGTGVAMAILIALVFAVDGLIALAMWKGWI